ncbi:MAG: murein DD-endopeptidase MepM/ murein hydrolase activator NlpD [Myxococcota bacterium]
MTLNRTIAAYATVLLAASSGCDLAAADLDSEPVIPADHPCPGIALTPATSSLYADAFDAMTPVPLPVIIPLAAGFSAPVSQGNDDTPTHHNELRYAYDLAVPLGTEVVAAAPGTVILVREDSTRFGPDDTFRDDANYVGLDHGGGLFTSYVHLAVNGVSVSVGDRVEAGDVIGVTGNSGQLTGPHLHFQVENIWGTSLPTRFVGAGGSSCDLQLTRGDVVVGEPNDGGALIVQSHLSEMPADSFEENGVTSLSGLPARLFSKRRPISFSGRAASGATEVFVLILPPEGGDAVAFLGVPVESERFSGALDLGPLAPGNYGFGMVAVDALEQVRVARSIRISIQ